MKSRPEEDIDYVSDVESKGLDELRVLVSWGAKTARASSRNLSKPYLSHEVQSSR